MSEPGDPLASRLAEQLAHYQEHGYARLGQVLDEPALSGLRERFDDLVLGRVVHPDLYFQLDTAAPDYHGARDALGWRGPSLDYRKVERLEKDERFLAAVRHPAIERVVRARIPGAIVLYRAIVFNKTTRGGGEVGWHQDGGRLWGLSREPEVQVWTALDDAPLDGGCLEVLPGSHRFGLATPLGGNVPEDKLRAGGAEENKVLLPAVAGESILLHNHLWHRSGRSLTGRRRLGLSVCYLSAETRCLRKKRAPREFFKVWGVP
jgi:ectoine hydroxylase-related dioxygenase (phytanoyl-CoA dioxygenase family)